MRTRILSAGVAVVMLILLLASTCAFDRDRETGGAASPSPYGTTAEDKASADRGGDETPARIEVPKGTADKDATRPVSPADDGRTAGSAEGPGTGGAEGPGTGGAEGPGTGGAESSQPGGSVDLPGPPYAKPVEVLDRSVTCTPHIRGRKTVVLVPGTGMTVGETWSWGWEGALAEAGFGVCTVELHRRSVVSIYNQADHMVYAIRKAHRLSGRKVSVIGHSQGGSHPLWAMKFWPDVRAAVDDYIGLAPGVNGTRAGDLACASGSCSALSWQVRFGSAYLTRLHRGGLPVGPTYTNVYTALLDEIVFPQPAASHIPGGNNISVQSVCPLRVVDHATILADSVAWALALDALTHPGAADVSRLKDRLALCAAPFLPGVDPASTAVGLLSGGQHAVMGLVTEPQVAAEPPLPGYAR